MFIISGAAVLPETLLLGLRDSEVAEVGQGESRKEEVGFIALPEGKQYQRCQGEQKTNSAHRTGII